MRGQEVHVIVIYDVEDDRLRTRVMNVCKDYGLEHIQYSAFRGSLTPPLRKDLFARLSGTLGTKPGRVLVLPICEKDLAAAQELRNKPSSPPASAE